ncbi:MAG: fibronectin type III domain-containing protein [Terracidiphilus sp.]
MASLAVDTSYACTVDATNHVVCPARSSITRPGGSTAWDAGAYEFESSSSTPSISSFSASPSIVSSGATSTLSWNISNASSVAITPGSFSTSTLIGSTTVNPTSTTVYTITATNTNGTSTATTSVSVATAPTAPQNLSATPGNTSISLSWSAPSSTGGSGLTQYLLYDRFTGSSTFALYASTTASQTNATATSLTNGQSYDFEVLAQNIIGTSTASNIVSSTPYTIPNSPTGISATAGNAEATISFTPGSNGGSSVLYYTAVSSPSNIAASSSGSPIVVPNLTNGQAYTFVVTATNLAGTSANSSSSNSVTPNNTYPTISSFNASPSAVQPSVSSTLSWTTTNASSVSINQGIGSVATSTGSVIVHPTSTTIYTMTATNSNGSTTAQTTILVNGTPPSVPTSVTANAVSQSEIDLSWASSTGNIGVAGYDIYQGNAFLASTTNLTYANTGLAASTQYTYYLSAFDAAGNVSATSTSISATTQAASSGGGGGGGGSSGGGGGGYYMPPATSTTTSTSATSSFSTAGMSITQMESLLATLEAELQTLEAQAGGSSASFTFTRNLSLGSSGLDVKALQYYLNTHGFPVTTTPAYAGSLGYETEHFGAATEKALALFQKAHGIAPVSGFFGPITRAYVNGHE